MHTQQQANPELLKSAIPMWEIARALKGSGLELAAEIMKGPLSPITDPDLYRVCVTMAADLIFKHTRALTAENAMLRDNMTLGRYSHDEIEAACGGEIAMVVRKDVMKRRAAIIAETQLNQDKADGMAMEPRADVWAPV